MSPASACAVSCINRVRDRGPVVQQVRLISGPLVYCQRDRATLSVVAITCDIVTGMAVVYLRKRGRRSVSGDSGRVIRARSRGRLAGLSAALVASQQTGPLSDNSLEEAPRVSE